MAQKIKAAMAGTTAALSNSQRIDYKANSSCSTSKASSATRNAMHLTKKKPFFQPNRLNNHRHSIHPDYARYADLKQRWIDTNPAASQAEHDIAMQRLARECGV